MDRTMNNKILSSGYNFNYPYGQRMPSNVLTTNMAVDNNSRQSMSFTSGQQYNRFSSNSSSVSLSGIYSNHSTIHNSTCFPKQRYSPYYSRQGYSSSSYNQQLYSQSSFSNGNNSHNNIFDNHHSMNVIDNKNIFSLNEVGGGGIGGRALSLPSSTSTSSSSSSSSSSLSLSSCINEEKNQILTLLISNLDSSFDEKTLRIFLVSKLKPITPVISLIFETNSSAKVKVPSAHFAKMVIAHLHRKKFGHKRILVSYNRDLSSTELSTLCCQVAGLLKDVPCYTLPLCKFRELFQARFKVSISVLELYKMEDVCVIETDEHDEKHIRLHVNFITKIDENPLVASLQHSVPYCTTHFKREHFKGWAEQDIEPLPNVIMNISQIQSMLYSLLKNHKGDIPIASLHYCIADQLNYQIIPNDIGVNLEHLVCCVNSVHITTNNFGIKILTWSEMESMSTKESYDGDCYRFGKSNSSPDPLYQISREAIELLKMAPKSTLKFNRFIPAYHNHFGKQCRVADYGYTRLIELFEALSSVVQVMGEGENRQITLTHRTQIRRFTADLLRVLKNQVNKTILLSQLPRIFSHFQNRPFDVTDYGVCDIGDILEGLVHSNAVVISNIEKDILISIPKRKQNCTEIEKTCIFAGEIVELCRNAPQYSILFQKFVRSYHYHFGFQCRLSDYGFLKLADLLEAIGGIVELEANNDEDRKIYLSPKVAQRVFSEQINELIAIHTGGRPLMMKMEDVLSFHKNKYGYQIHPQAMGCQTIENMIKSLPYVEVIEQNGEMWIVCYSNDLNFKCKMFMAILIFIENGVAQMTFSDFVKLFYQKYKENLTESSIFAMKHAIRVQIIHGLRMIMISPTMKFILRIINILETQNVTNLTDLKSLLNVSISTCFEFGYPNLSSLLNSFPEIFILSPIANERCDVKLNTLCLLAKKNLTEYFQRLDKNLFPSAEMNYSQFIPTGVNFLENRTFDNGQTKTIENGGTHNKFYQKDDSFDSYAHNFNYQTHPNYGKLYERRHMTGINNIKVENPYAWLGNRTTAESLPFSLRAAFYEPPKPDTPPSKVLPFWIDPVWGPGKEDSPTIESLNIHLPELNTLNIFPVVVSPCAHTVTNQQFTY